MSSNAVAMEILSWAARSSLPAAVIEHSPVAALEAVDWHLLLWLGRQTRGLLFLRHALLEKGAPLPCPPEIRAQLEDLHSAVQLQGLARAKELCSLHDLFAAGGLPFVMIDDWLFEQSFAGTRSVAEKTGPLRVIVTPTDIERARALLATAGRAELSSRFHVASPGQTPVALVAEETAREARASLPVGSRCLPVFNPSQWLRYLAREAGRRNEIDFVLAWQVVVLDSKYGDQSAAADPSIIPEIARCRHVCGLTTTSDVAHRSPQNSPPLATPARAYAPYVPTSPRVAERMLALAGTGPGDNVFDLGCGDGRILIAAAKKFGARGIGIDLDPALITQAKAAAEAANVGDRTTFRCADLFSVDLSDASVVCLYLLPSLYAPVRELLRRARPGTRVVSHDYLFPQWQPERTELMRSDPARISQIYLWRLP